MKPGFIGRVRAAARQVLRAPIGHLLRAREHYLREHLEHELAICAIFRAEAPFLEEWLTFHLTIGATHFYLYNNESRDDFARVLRPWRERGLVSLADWPGTAQQLPVYADCVQKARSTCQWVAFIDIDEFLFSPQAIDIRPV